MKYGTLVLLLGILLVALCLTAQPGRAEEQMTPQMLQAQLTAALTNVLADALPNTAVRVTSEGNELTLAVNTRSYQVYATDMTGGIAENLHEEIGPGADGIYLRCQIREPRGQEQADLPGTFQRPYWTSYVYLTTLWGGKYEFLCSFSYGQRVSLALRRQMLGTILKMCPQNIPAELIARRNALLATADSQLRTGLRELAKTYPQLKESNFATLDTALAGQSPAGQITIEFAHANGLKGGATAEVAEKDRYVVRIYLESYTAAQAYTPRQMPFTTAYPFINLHGLVNTTAGDPALAEALTNLVRTALLPLETLNAETSGPGEV